MAIEALKAKGYGVPLVSRSFRTPSFPAGAGPDYVNAAAVLLSDAEPDAILTSLHEIEDAFGRLRTHRWGNRGLDLDLLAAGNSVQPDRATFDRWRTLPLEEQISSAPDELVLPHPRIQDRSFVLVPLADIVPDWRHPVLDLTVTEMLTTLPRAALDGIVPL